MIFSRNVPIWVQYTLKTKLNCIQYNSVRICSLKYGFQALAISSLWEYFTVKCPKLPSKIIWIFTLSKTNRQTNKPDSSLSCFKLKEEMMNCTRYELICLTIKNNCFKGFYLRRMALSIIFWRLFELSLNPFIIFWVYYGFIFWFNISCNFTNGKQY